ncbi:MAG TPA: hypothetical protein VGS21_07595, partial [Acidimicrobiales bacterium]|nr:hypothetical protein [Acidimicrobiales bacterium]
MDQGSAINEQQEATPIFTAYRRGYDPEQVDRYVADQQRRLDETLHRASEAERKLAAAIGQLRELHRRVATLESEDRAAKSEAPTLDALGERVQRILQEAWEGAYSLRQNAEREVSELRESVAHEVGELRERTQREVLEERTKALTEIAEKVDAAERRATLMREETERRRQAYLERVDEDREQAVAQITYLYDQRQTALGELARLQATIEATVEEMARSPLGVPNPVSHATRKSSRHHEPIDERPVEPFATVEPARPTPEAGEMRMPGLEKPVSVYGSAEAGIPASEFATSAAAPAPPS